MVWRWITSRSPFSRSRPPREEQRLQVRLLPNWAEADNPGGPSTFIRTDDEESGALQVSLQAQHAGGAVPDPSPQQLVEMAVSTGERNAAGALVETSSGTCALGTFGSAVFRSQESPRMQFWVLSNGLDFVLATHICVVEPDPAEVAEARQIVEMLGLSV